MLLLFDLHYKPMNGEDPEGILKKYLPYPHNGFDFWLIRSSIKRIPRENQNNPLDSIVGSARGWDFGKEVVYVGDRKVLQDTQ